MFIECYFGFEPFNLADIVMKVRAALPFALVVARLRPSPQSTSMHASNEQGLLMRSVPPTL